MTATGAYVAGSERERISGTPEVICPACQHSYPIRINAAVTLSAHLEDDHRWPLDHVMRVVVEACGP